MSLNVTLSPRAWADLAPAELFALVGRLEAAGVTSVVLTDPASTGEPGPWRWDPPTAVGALAGLSSAIGLVTTVAAAFTEPLSASRQVGTLDHFAHGRVGWLLDVPEDPVRAVKTRAVSPVLTEGDPDGRAAELVAAARSLWDGWEEGAFSVDVARGTIVDRERIHASDFEGRHFRVSGPSTLRRPPSGNPPVFVRVHDAGSAALAGAVADVALVPSADLVHAVTEAAEATGRDDGPVVLASVTPDGLGADLAFADGVDLVADAEPDAALLASLVGTGTPSGSGLRAAYALPLLRGRP